MGHSHHMTSPTPAPAADLPRSPQRPRRGAALAAVRRPRAAMAVAATLSVGALVALAACAAGVGNAAGDQTQQLVAFAGAKSAHDGAQAAWATERAAGGKEAGAWRTSYGASGEQSRAMTHGLSADVVHLSTTADMRRLVEADIIAPEWDAGPTKGILTRSVVVLVVRAGNPKGITGWSDLTAPGIGIVTPNPGSSGAARWNILAGYGAALDAASPGTAPSNDGSAPVSPEASAAGERFLTGLFANVVSLPGSGRDATTSFLGGTGDVLLSQENEAIFARQHGADLEYIVPPVTLLVENPGAVTTTATPASQDYIRFLRSVPGQDAFAQAGFRPVPSDGGTGQADSPGSTGVVVRGATDPSAPFPAPDRMLTMAGDFGGWKQATDDFFDDDGLVTRIQSSAGAR